jgi:ribonuclease BN (tRNA processing enzyme)
VDIKILGIGGFANSGLPFNSYLINGHVLVDTPPDILQSLKRENVSLNSIDTIVITHFHGDHCFGLPFLLFNMFLQRAARNGNPPRILGPSGIKAKIPELLSLAISPEHPYLKWVMELSMLLDIDETTTIGIERDVFLSFFKTDHEPETFAIRAFESRQEEPSFVASSDTRWSRRLTELFSKGKLFLCDGNGDGLGGVHMSPQEIKTFVIPLLPKDAKLVVTHLTNLPETDDGLVYAKPGDFYRI